jgi:hypothetical protein
VTTTCFVARLGRAIRHQTPLQSLLIPLLSLVLLLDKLFPNQPVAIPLLWPKSNGLLIQLAAILWPQDLHN